MAEGGDEEKLSAADALRAGQAVARLAEGDMTALKDADAVAKAAKPVFKIWLGCCAAELALGLFVFLLLASAIGGPSGPENANTGTGAPASNWSGSTDTVSTLGKAKMPATSGKIGHEQHASKQSCFKSGEIHYDGPLSFVSRVGSVANCMAFGKPRTSEQEAWYFNMRWDTSSGYPNNVMHKKVIITNPVNGKRVVASIEEYGPGARLMTRDGINSGASPEVYKYLGLANPYTGNPNDKKGYATFGFAKDQDIPLGPLK